MDTEPLRAALACLSEARQAMRDPERLPAMVLNRAMLHQIEYGQGNGVDQFIDARVDQAEALMRDALRDLEAESIVADACLSDLLAEIEQVDVTSDFTDPALKRVAELVFGLDAHLRAGGALPAPWRTATRQKVAL